MKNNTVLLVSGFLVLIIGIHVVVVGYLVIPQDKEWTVNYSLPAGKLETGGKNYTIGGVYIMKYTSRDLIWVETFRPDHLYRGSYDEPGDLYVIFTNEYNNTLEVYRLVSISRWASFMARFYWRELRIYLGSPLSHEELSDQGYYGDWNVTFVLRHYPSALDLVGLHYGYLFRDSGTIMILVGVVVTTFSLIKTVRSKTGKT